MCESLNKTAKKTPPNPLHEFPKKRLRKSPKRKNVNQKRDMMNNAESSIQTTKDSYKVYLATQTSIPLSRSHHEALMLVLWKNRKIKEKTRETNENPRVQELAAISHQSPLYIGSRSGGKGLQCP